MQKHIEDDGDVDIFVNDDGVIVMVCGKCKRIWTTGPVAVADAERASRSMETSVRRNSAVFDRAGVDPGAVLSSIRK